MNLSRLRGLLLLGVAWLPRLWGPVGIAYRKDLVKGKLTGWKQLLQPGQELRGRIMMIEDVREVVGAALKSLGYSLNSQDPKELDEAEELFALMAEVIDQASAS